VSLKKGEAQRGEHSDSEKSNNLEVYVNRGKGDTPVQGRMVGGSDPKKMERYVPLVNLGLGGSGRETTGKGKGEGRVTV